MKLLLQEIRHQPLLWLLVFVPAVFAVEALQPGSHTLLFLLSVLAIVPLAALLSHPQHFTGRRIGLVLSGGNIDTRLLASVLLRGLVRDGRIVRLRLMIGDLPGQLARVAGLIGKAGGNIVEVQHQRLFGSVAAKRTELDVTVETRGRDHVRELVAALSAEGFKVRVLEGADA